MNKFRQSSRLVEGNVTGGTASQRGYLLNDYLLLRFRHTKTRPVGCTYQLGNSGWVFDRYSGSGIAGEKRRDLLVRGQFMQRLHQASYLARSIEGNVDSSLAGQRADPVN